MKNQIHTEKENKEEELVQENHNDEYWAKKYDISVDELKETGDTDLSTLIIQAGIKRKSFQPLKA
ncbi:MAG: hypothetical protein JO080_11695 [Mucilaginibacter sp.]|nr:hypothetical protein [Mucilaginibacter sp.]